MKTNKEKKDVYDTTKYDSVMENPYKGLGTLSSLLQDALLMAVKPGTGKSAQVYEATTLSWAKSEEQEEQELRELILGNPADVKLLKKEYEQLTGKKFRRKKGE